MTTEIANGQSSAHPWVEVFRAHRPSLVAVIIVLACTEISFVMEFLELHRLRLHTALFWICQLLFVLGITEFFSGIKTLALKEMTKDTRSASIRAFSLGILMIVLSLFMQLQTWETIGRTSVVPKP